MPFFEELISICLLYVKQLRQQMICRDEDFIADFR